MYNDLILSRLSHAKSTSKITVKEGRGFVISKTSITSLLCLLPSFTLQGGYKSYYLTPLVKNFISPFRMAE